MNKLESLKYLNSIGINTTEEDYDNNSTKTVVVGMSGGVDSSVSALLIKMQGYKTVGIFMKNWEETGADGKCTSEEEYNDVISVAEKIDIPYFSVNFVEEYKENVFKSFIEEYKAGFTPNPDILCNREIKFKVFFAKAMDLGADYLATGHYCQHEIINSKSNLTKGYDTGKDQTYFLYTMQEKVLSKVLFPIGHLEKKIVRKVATDFDLATAAKKDSTGICFIGERNFKNFLSQYIKEQKGEFVRLDDNKSVGPHDGYCYYTIGQRKGLGLGGPGGPWFVSGKNVETNTVYVVEGEKHPALYTDYLYATDLSWVTEEPSFPLECRAKVRYRQQDQDCVVTKEDDGKLKVIFKEAQRAVAIRQSVVFYQENICLGGAIISESAPTYFELNKSV
jgi:tRNA-specific 2-thiouridylase